MLFVRALLAFLALPAIVGGLVPWWLSGNAPWTIRGTLLGLPVMFIGAGIVMWCVRDFYVIGKGTLAPWDPPRKLVIVGLYRFTRNPMYIGVLTWVAGWSLVAASLRLVIYTAVLIVAFRLRVILFEEPVLAQKFGADWTRYREKVNRWLPKRPAISSS